MRNYIFRITFIVIVILEGFLAFGQKNFVSGKIINLNGDTISGFIDYRDHVANPKLVSFKEAIESSEIQIFYPHQLKAFFVADRLFEANVVKLEVSPYKPDELDYVNTNFNYRIDTVFLQALVIGTKSLFYYKDDLGKENFYIMKGGKYELLKCRRYLSDVDKASIVENRRYVRQLNDYFNGEYKLLQKTKQTKYNSKDLIKLFKYYYKHSNSDNSYEIEHERAKFRVGILAGVSLTKPKFNAGDGYWDYLTKADFSTSQNPVLGISLNIVLPRNMNKWSIKNEVLYTSYKVKGDYTRIIAEGYYEEASSILGYSYLKLNNLLDYKFVYKKINIHFKAGLSNAIALSEINKGEYKSITYDIVIVDEQPPLPYSSKHEYGFVIGTGIEYKKISIESRFERTAGMGGTLMLGTNINRVYFLLSYSF